MNQAVIKQLTRARTCMILDQPFFGSLALALPLVETTQFPTLAVDGKKIYYNPDYVSKLSHELTMTAVAHEVMHCVYSHFCRREGREPRKFNKAGDYVINATLKEAGFQLHPSWLYDRKYDGMSTDAIYKLLADEEESGEGEGEGGGGDPQDEVLEGEADSQQAVDWKVATIQAANAAKEYGSLPASIERLIEEFTNPKVDWRAMLRQLITEKLKEDYSWSRPNRRMQSLGFTLPSLYSEGMGEVAIVIDTSGSISQETLNTFGTEVKAVMESVRPAKTHVIYCDTDVNHVDVFEPNDEVTFKMHGGGGTSFVEPFLYLAEQGVRPVCLIYLTDLEGEFGDEPDYPVIWACTEKHIAPWGITVPIGD